MTEDKGFGPQEQAQVKRAQESGVEGYRADSDDVLGDLDIYEALIDPNGAGGKAGKGRAGGPMMMPPMGMGGTGQAGSAAGLGTGQAAGGGVNGALGAGGLGAPGGLGAAGGLASGAVRGGAGAGAGWGGLGGGMTAGAGGAGMGGAGLGGGFGTSAAGTDSAAGIDTDGDGIADTFANGGIDTDGDGVADYFPEGGGQQFVTPSLDSNGGVVPDQLVTTPSGAGTTPTGYQPGGHVDSDGDGTPDSTDTYPHDPTNGFAPGGQVNDFGTAPSGGGQPAGSVPHFASPSGGASAGSPTMGGGGGAGAGAGSFGGGAGGASTTHDPDAIQNAGSGWTKLAQDMTEVNGMIGNLTAPNGGLGFISPPADNYSTLQSTSGQWATNASSVFTEIGTGLASNAQGYRDLASAQIKQSNDSTNV